jgi:hypothetical protein
MSNIRMRNACNDRESIGAADAGWSANRTGRLSLDAM